MPGRPRTGGLPLTLERGATSKQRLQIEWEHPAVVAAKGGPTQAAGALPLDEALGLLWNHDERPLLVLRDVPGQKRDDCALLATSIEDRAVLLTKWLHTVRLPENVLDPSHPFHRVFASVAGKDGTPQVLLFATPHAAPVVLSGAESPLQLWRCLCDVLMDRYTRDPAKAVKQWLALLEQFDGLDQRHGEVRQQLDAARADDGAQSPRAKKLADTLARLEAERDEVLQSEQKARDLGLRAVPFPVARLPAK